MGTFGFLLNVQVCTDTTENLISILIKSRALIVLPYSVSIKIERAGFGLGVTWGFIVSMANLLLKLQTMAPGSKIAPSLE